MNSIQYLLFAVIAMVAQSPVATAQGVLPVHRYVVPNASSSYTWDATPGTAGIDNSSGTWNATLPNWIKVPTAAPNVVWVAGSNAIFGGNPGTNAAGTVTVTGTMTARNITFNATPSGNFTITSTVGSGAINFGASGGMLTANQQSTINAQLTGGGASAVFLKRGQQILALSGTNTISGNFIISQGIVAVGTSSAVGTAQITLGDAATASSNVGMYWAGSVTLPNNLVVTNNGTGTMSVGSYNAGTNTIFSGTLTLNRSVILYDLSGDRTAFTGVVSGNAGTITIDASGTYTSATGAGGRVTLDNNANTFTGLVIINFAKAFQITGITVMNNNPVQCDGSLILNIGTGNTAVMGTLTGGAAGICEIFPTASGTQTLSIGNDNGSGTYSGIIRNAGAGTGIINLIKAGSGTELLNGASTYTGTTSINAGILGGTGSLTSATTVGNAGKIMGGTGTGNAGVFTTGALTFVGAADLDVHSSGAAASRLQVNGACTFVTTAKINLLDAMATGSYTIVTSTGTMSAALPVLGTNSSGHTVAISKSGNNLIVTLT